MKKMKNIYYFLFMALAMMTVSCSDHNLSDDPEDSNGMAVHMSISAPSYQTTDSRAGASDQDGDAIRTLKLLCFDKDGYFLGEGSTTFTNNGENTGEISGSVPSNTCRIHFVANANLTSIESGNYKGVSENVMIPTLYSGYGIVNYWGYKRCTSVDEMQSFINNGSIGLIRNQAKVSVANSTGNTNYDIVGVAVCNVNAFGTVALFDNTKFGSDPFTDAYTTLTSTTPPTSTDIVSSVTDDKNIKADNPQDVESGTDYNIFEGANTANDHVAVIVKLSNNTYHKILLEDASYNFLTLHRNHNYTITIKGMAEAGESTFSAALNGAAANNPLISIGDEVASLSYDNRKLEITNGTSQILGGGKQTISFTYDRTDGIVPQIADLSAEWDSNDNTVSDVSKGKPVIAYNSSTKKGTITVNLLSASNTLRSGKLYLKVNNTALIRAINIYSISGFTFQNLSVSRNIDDGYSGQQCVLSFDIPANFPKSLLPLKCKIVTNRFDADPTVNNLQIVNEDTNTSEFGYKTWNYKYVYYAYQTGPQHIYFKTVDTGYLSDNTKNKTIWVTAPNFDTASADFGFLPYYYYEDAITLSGTDLENQPPLKGNAVTVAVSGLSSERNCYIYTNNFTPAGASVSTDANYTKLHPGVTCYSISASGLTTLTLTSNKTNYSENVWVEQDYHRSGNVLIRTNSSYYSSKFSASVTSPKYGNAVLVTMTINFPVADGNHTYTISTKNLSTNDLTYSNGLYYITPTQTTQSIKFYTKNLVNNETITVKAPSTIEVADVTCSLVNELIKGTLTCETFRPTPFIYIEDTSGNRVGTITRSGSGTSYNYSLTLRSYYNLTKSSTVYLLTNDKNNKLAGVKLTIADLLNNASRTLVENYQ